jgi:3-hydroxyisobutyrate dehydrogenase-like beta-hydroxyacid dehydrogenase
MSSMNGELVGVVGVGRMGGAFAALLARAGHAVMVVDPSEERRSEAAACGCAVAAHIAELVHADANPILLSLPTEDAFTAVVAELTQSIAGTAAPPSIVELSTLHPTTKEHARRDLLLVGAELLDCPVSGTGAQARAGDIVVFASGSERTVRRVQPVLEVFARRVHYVGPFGAGSTVKLLANLLVGVHNAAAAEMLAFAERAGVDPAVALDVIVDGAGQSRMLEQRGPGMVRGDYGYGATVDLFRKDLGLIGRLAGDSGAWTPLLQVVTDLYERAAGMGLGDAESAAVHRVYTSGAPVATG